MDIHRLETFRTVFEQESFSKAGALLHLAQPTISSHISGLEKELGTILFDRFPRRILPTQAAKILYSYAQVITEARQKAIADIALLSGTVSGKLRLGGSTIPGHFILPQYMSRFQSRYPQVELSLEIGDSRSIEEGIQAGNLDIGIIGGRENVPDIQYIQVAEDELWILAPAGHNYPAWKPDIKAQTKWPWIIREAGSGTRKAMFSFLQDSGISMEMMQVQATVSSTQAVLSCIQAGLGVSMVSSLAAAGPLSRSEIQRVCPETESPRRAFYAAVHLGRAQFPATKAFLRLFGGTGQERIKPETSSSDEGM